MARLRIDIACDGRAFRDPRGGLKPEPEATSILIRYVTAVVRTGGLDQALYDHNGNLVGTATFDASDLRLVREG